MGVGRFQRAFNKINSNVVVGYPQIVKSIRRKVLSKVQLSDTRSVVMFVDENTSNLDRIAAETRKFQNVNVIVVAVGKVNEDKLNMFVSYSKKVRLIRANSFESLRSMKLSLLDEVCREDHFVNGGLWVEPN